MSNFLNMFASCSGPPKPDIRDLRNHEILGNVGKRIPKGHEILGNVGKRIPEGQLESKTLNVSVTGNTEKKVDLGIVKYNDCHYTKPISVGINTRLRWELVQPDLTPFESELKRNPHKKANTNPEQFWIKASDLIAMLEETMGLAAPTRLAENRHDDWKEAAKELYGEAALDKYYPDFPDNRDTMTWYKFNRTYSENLTRYMGKGISFCYNPGVKTLKDLDGVKPATCMISYMYDSDPSEVREVLVKLIADGIITGNDKVFFCSFANYQVNNEKFNNTDLGNKKAPTVDEQVNDNPFEKIANRVQKFIILHTGGNKDIYSRKWCNYELTRALKAIENPEKKIYMTGSSVYHAKVRAALIYFNDESKWKENVDLATYKQYVWRSGESPGYATHGPDKVSPFRLRDYTLELVKTAKNPSVSWYGRIETKNQVLVEYSFLYQSFTDFSEAVKILEPLKPVDSFNSICQKDGPNNPDKTSNMLNTAMQGVEVTVPRGFHGNVDQKARKKSYEAVNFIVNAARKQYQGMIASGSIDELKFVEIAASGVADENKIILKDMTVKVVKAATQSYDLSMAEMNRRQGGRRRAQKSNKQASIEKITSTLNSLKDVVSELADDVSQLSRVISNEERNNQPTARGGNDKNNQIWC